MYWSRGLSVGVDDVVLLAVGTLDGMEVEYEVSVVVIGTSPVIPVLDVFFSVSGASHHVWALLKRAKRTSCSLHASNHTLFVVCQANLVTFAFSLSLRSQHGVFSVHLIGILTSAWLS